MRRLIKRRSRSSRGNCAHGLAGRYCLLHQKPKGDTKIAGILGMDTLYIRHAIIDLDGMNLFLK